jgi:hypothetical protein
MAATRDRLLARIALARKAKGARWLRAQARSEAGPACFRFAWKRASPYFANNSIGLTGSRRNPVRPIPL